jgi:hypothetical protein
MAVFKRLEKKRKSKAAYYSWGSSGRKNLADERVWENGI